jgi:hypothetical protein
MSRTSALPREARSTRRGLPPFSVLLTDLKNEFLRLARGEFALLKSELTEKATHAAVAIGLFVGAALLAFFALATLIACAVVALSLVVPAWLAAVITAVGLIVIAGILALIGRHSLKTALPPVPEETIGNVREDLGALAGRNE